jgi:aryl-alcohol dehydrogenase-like predicted oxidoreductase
VLRRAIELGVDFIDTADSYGPEVSERLIGETLRPLDGLMTPHGKGGGAVAEVSDPPGTRAAGRGGRPDRARRSRRALCRTDPLAPAI